MDRRTRVCILVIVVGLANFLAYTVMYMFLNGDAMNGYVHAEKIGGKLVRHFFLVAKGEAFEVSKSVWIYSAVHSISIWVTVGAVLLAMLTLAKDRIVSSMTGGIVQGRTFITILATVVALISVLVTVWFLLYMIHQLAWPARVGGT